MELFIKNIFFLILVQTYIDLVCGVSNKIVFQINLNYFRFNENFSF
jgi:hypothetical protein